MKGDTLSAADVWMFWALHWIHDTQPYALTPFPTLQYFHANFAMQPAVAAVEPRAAACGGLGGAGATVVR